MSAAAGEASPKGDRSLQFLYVLPVLFYEFLALAVTRSVLPRLFVDYFGDYVYHVIGIVETVKGVLAFVSCPLFGKLSDKVGRKRCLLITIIGTTLPVCTLAFTTDLWIYAVAQGLSGCFASTFTLVFAFIADSVAPKERAPAYGLALATLGLSFTIGPVTGGYLARQFGDQAVFSTSLMLVLADVAFVVFVLPESNEPEYHLPDPFRPNKKAGKTVDLSVLPQAYNPLDALEVFFGDPLLAQIARVTFLYYTGVWALVSTMMIYLVNRFHMTKVEIGYLLAAYGLATMLSEGLLVRLMVPNFGERTTMRIGLLAFAAQCVIIGLADDPTIIWYSIVLALFSNLVYPSLSSLVSRSVDSSKQGEAQGAINGVKALTEGFGPLCFGFLMQLFEDSPVPGAPYLVSGLVTIASVALTYQFPSEEDYARFQAASKPPDDGSREGLLAEHSRAEQTESMAGDLEMPGAGASSDR